ncbi:DgoK 2-keto-3-deoxy-galactonokinase [Candidatus Nanopelagicaceae bacterium]
MKFVAIDWGTSSFRAWLIEHDQISDQIDTDQGVKNFTEGAHSTYLNEVLAKWSGQFNFIIAIGMVGSSIGMHETKFSAIPIDLTGVFNSLIKVPAFNPDLYIVPGVAKAGDVMRGEESQSLATGIVNGLVVLPGTHSKWVKMQNCEIVDFRTYLTGELFELLRNHSTLSKATESSAKLAVSKEFYAGLDAPVSDLTHELFTIRAKWLQGKSQEASREYLSGLLIGAEIKSAKSWIAAREVTVIASDSLADTYSKALSHFGITSNVQSQMTLISYFAAIAKKVEAQI